MRCGQVRARLSAYLDNELTDSSEPKITEHLSVCGRCSELRAALNLSRDYLRKLKDSPAGDFRPDMERVFLMPPVSPAWVFIKRGMAAAVLGVVALAFYFAASPAPLIEFAQKPIASFSRDINFLKKLAFSSRGGIPGLSEGKEAVFDTVYPTLIKTGEGSWVSVEGRASLYKDKSSLKIDVGRGEIYFISDNPLSFQKIITTAGFQITSFKTAFFIRTEGLKTDIQLLAGQLTIKRLDRKNLISARISGGEGAAGRGSAKNKTLDVYKLSPSQKSGLEAKINRIKKIGLWFERHPKQASFQSGEIRIEYWKEE